LRLLCAYLRHHHTACDIWHSGQGKELVEAYSYTAVGSDSGSQNVGVLFIDSRSASTD